jgi:predicted histidine transporter YuiF (NhaC family)
VVRPGLTPLALTMPIGSNSGRNDCPMKSKYYITLIIGLGFLPLAGCTGVPIAKTNCWATAGSTVTTSTMGASPDAGLVSRGKTSSLDVIPCR